MKLDFTKSSGRRKKVYVCLNAVMGSWRELVVGTMSNEDSVELWSQMDLGLNPDLSSYPLGVGP